MIACGCRRVLELVRLVQATLVAAGRSRPRLVVQNLLLRQQLKVALRSQRRPQIRARDKLFWLIVRRRQPLLVQPETVLNLSAIEFVRGAR